MPWEPWLRTDQRALARYANPEAVRLLPKLPANPADLRGDRDGKLKTLRLIYETLCGCGIQYDRAPVSFTPGEQIIRQPIDILHPPQQGTCLDLALLMSGLCVHYDLLPVLVLIKGHALVVVSRTQYVHDLLRQQPDELNIFIRGLLQADRSSILRTLVDNREYAALECTGFAATHRLAPTVPEGNGRDRASGLLTFERAMDAGREQLDLAERPFLYALDIVGLHRQQLPYPIHLPYESSDESSQSTARGAPTMAGNSKARRCADLAANIDSTLELIRQYEQQRLLTDDPRTRLRAEHNIKDLRDQMAAYEQERHELACGDTVIDARLRVPMEDAIRPGAAESGRDQRHQYVAPPPDLSQADRSKLAGLLYDSGRVAYTSRTALCLEIDIDPGRLTFMQVGDRDFAIQLVAQLHKTGNIAALRRLCEAIAPELGGQPAARLWEIRARLG